MGESEHSRGYMYLLLGGCAEGNYRESCSTIRESSGSEVGGNGCSAAPGPIPHCRQTGIAGWLSFSRVINMRVVSIFVSQSVLLQTFIGVSGNLWFFLWVCLFCEVCRRLCEHVLKALFYQPLSVHAKSCLSRLTLRLLVTWPTTLPTLSNNLLHHTLHWLPL